MSDPAGRPRLHSIALVTPSLNTAPWLHQTLASVREQRYPALEHVVVDGGSTDGSLNIIDAFRPGLHAVITEPDGGHADAINKGFARTSGELMGWINSDDLLHHDALATVDAVFAAFPDVDWITGIPTTAKGDDPTRITINRGRNFTYGDFLAGDYEWLQQESTFWRRSLWERAGGQLDTGLRLAVDFELWMRFFRHARLHTVDALLGAFRRREGQRSKLHLGDYRREAAEVIVREQAVIRSGAIVPPDGSLQRTPGTRLPRRIRKPLQLPRQAPMIGRRAVDQALADRWMLRTGPDAAAGGDDEN